MRLVEALNILKGMSQRQGRTLTCSLASGFTPLHLKTFLSAELCRLFPQDKVEIAEGVYGDLPGNLQRLSQSACEFGLIFIEWADLDPRLGIRNTARWSNSELSDILATAQKRASLLQRLIEQQSGAGLMAVSLPTLPILPLSFTPLWQAGSFELDLLNIAHSLGSGICRLPHVRVLNSQSLDQESPLQDRHDIESELRTGFPYRLSHASILAASVARLLQQRTPKKGLITDLDNTLWRGIVGDDGVDGISWDLEHHSQIHALYQRCLGSLAAAGVLIGVASKNDAALVETAFQRDDLAISPLSIFPVEAHWQPKSESVARILATWNIGPDSVVFVDDNPLELAEVKAAHPEVECLLFPTTDGEAIYRLIQQLKNLFGRPFVLEEDTIRIESLRRAHAPIDLAEMVANTDFFDQLEGEVTFAFGKAHSDPRALELINKTNQFNLNGRRFTDHEWNRHLSEPHGFSLIASYRDKFGPLGKVAVITGSMSGAKLLVDTWVMSCRAFSRRIEYKCLAELLARFRPGTVEFDFLETDRNGPLRSFLREVLGVAPSPHCIASAELLEARVNDVLKSQEVLNG
jgi:FkbH-like protein